MTAKVILWSPLGVHMSTCTCMPTCAHTVCTHTCTCMSTHTNHIEILVAAFPSTVDLCSPFSQIGLLLFFLFRQSLAGRLSLEADHYQMEANQEKASSSHVARLALNSVVLKMTLNSSCLLLPSAGINRQVASFLIRHVRIKPRLCSSYTNTLPTDLHPYFQNIN